MFFFSFVFLALMEYALVNVVLGDGPEGGSSSKNEKKEDKKSKLVVPMFLRNAKVVRDVKMQK